MGKVARPRVVTKNALDTEGPQAGRGSHGSVAERVRDEKLTRNPENDAR